MDFIIYYNGLMCQLTTRVNCMLFFETHIINFIISKLECTLDKIKLKKLRTMVYFGYLLEHVIIFGDFWKSIVLNMVSWGYQFLINELEGTYFCHQWSTETIMALNTEFSKSCCHLPNNPEMTMEQVSRLLIMFLKKIIFWSHYDDNPLKDVEKMAIILKKI